MSTPNEFLKEIRLKRGMTQNQLARALGYTTPQYVSVWERNEVPLPYLRTKKIIKALKMTKEEIAAFKERVMEEARQQVEGYFPKEKRFQ